MKTIKFIALFAIILVGTVPIKADDSAGNSVLNRLIYPPPSLSVDESNLIHGMIGLFETFEAAELSIDTFSIDTSTTYQELLSFLNEKLVDTSVIDSMATIVGNAAINLSNAISDERFAGLIFIATGMYVEGISSFSSYMSEKGYVDKDIENIGSDLLTYDATAGINAPPCNKVFTGKLAAIASGFVRCAVGAGPIGSLGCSAAAGILIWDAALEQCECFCARYGTVPSGCSSCN